MWIETCVHGSKKLLNTERCDEISIQWYSEKQNWELMDTYADGNAEELFRISLWRGEACDIALTTIHRELAEYVQSAIADAIKEDRKHLSIVDVLKRFCEEHDKEVIFVNCPYKGAILHGIEMVQFKQ